MTKFNDILVFYWSVRCDGFFDGGENDPVVVGVVEGVAGDLLTLRGYTSVVVSEGVSIWVGVKVGFCVFVHYGDGVVVVDISGLTCHWIVG